MDLALSEEQQTWHDAAARFAAAELGDDVRGAGRARRVLREGYLRCARFGIQGLTVPGEFGGKGLDFPTAVAAMEGLGFGCPDTGLVFAINASLWTVTMPILAFGTEEQKRRWLPGLCDGTLFGANAASEPGAGSDIFGMQTRAERRGDGWVLNGRKTWITGGPVADLFLAFATTDPAKGVLGITAFLIPARRPASAWCARSTSSACGPPRWGSSRSRTARCRPEALLGREGRGAKVFNAALEWERGAILAGVLGTMRRQVERCIEQARTRKQFGQPIGKFQAVAHRIVDMRLRLETCRPLVYRFARLKGEGKDAALEAAMAKLHVSECFVQNSLDAVRTFGASGYATETGLERDLRDSVGGVIFSGTNDIQRNIIAGHLRL